MAPRLFLATQLLVVAVGTAAHPAAAGWSIVRGEAITVLGDEPPDVLRTVATDLDGFRRALPQVVVTPDAQVVAPTVVFVFRALRELQAVLPAAIGDSSERRGLAYTDADANYVALTADAGAEVRQVAFHEYVHVALAHAIEGAPAWVSEGLAEYYSTLRLSRDGAEVEIGHALPRHRRLLQERRLPLRDLLEAAADSPLFYAESWSLVHFLLTTVPDGPDKLLRYMSALAEGAPPEAALAEAFGTDLASLDRQRAYAARMSTQMVRMPLSEPVDPEPPLEVAALSDGEAEAWLGDLQLRTRRLESDAVARIERASSLQPPDAHAQLALGRLRAEQQQSAQARHAFESATSLSPDDFYVQYLGGIGLLRLAPAIDVPERQEVRQAAYAALQRAAALAPPLPHVLMWQAYADLILNTRIPEARRLITRAIELAPSRPEYRLRLAEIALRQGEYVEAVHILTALSTISDSAIADAAREELASFAGSSYLGKRP